MDTIFGNSAYGIGRGTSEKSKVILFSNLGLEQVDDVFGMSK